MAQYSDLDRTFGAISAHTRRGILERLGRADATVSDLAAAFEMTLTGVRKHLQVLEGAGLVVTEKTGRVRTCRLAPRRMAGEAGWIAQYQKLVEARFNQLGALTDL